MKALGVLKVVMRDARTYQIEAEAQEDRKLDDEGREIAGGKSVQDILLSVQPISGKQLDSLKEGDRTKEPIALYSLTKLPLDDRVIIDDGYYTVRNFKFHRAEQGAKNAQGYYSSVAVRVGEVETVADE